MTTIAYKNGEIAADTLQSMDGANFNHATKIFDLEHYLVGMCGDASVKEDFLNFIQNKEFDSDCFKRIGLTDFRAIVIDKKTLQVSFYDALLKKIPIRGQDFIAIGSGGDYAKGAMAMGAGAVEAVLIASRFDPYTNDRIDVINGKTKLTHF